MENLWVHRRHEEPRACSVQQMGEEDLESNGCHQRGKYQEEKNPLNNPAVGIPTVRNSPVLPGEVAQALLPGGPHGESGESPLTPRPTQHTPHVGDSFSGPFPTKGIQNHLCHIPSEHGVPNMALKCGWRDPNPLDTQGSVCTFKYPCLKNVFL